MSEPEPCELSLVLPVFDQATELAACLRACREHFAARPALSYELIVVVDGARDGSAEIAAQAALADPRCRVIAWPDNRGKGAAVQAGVLAARGRRIGFCDVDLATPLRELDRLLAALDAGADLALASRRAPGARIELPQPLPRRLGGAVFRGLARLATGLAASDPLCGCKLFEREAARACFAELREQRYAFDLEVLCRARELGLTAREVGVSWRDGARSTVRPWRDAWPALGRLWRLASPARRGAGGELLVTLLALGLLLPWLGARSLWGSEARWAEGARWMLATGDWLTPRLDGVPYLLKPAPSYWPVALASAGRVTEFSARLPAALAAVLAVWGTARLGRRWGSPEVGLLAGSCLLSMGLVSFWARVGTGDLPTVAALVAAVLAGEALRRERRARWLYLLAGVCALGSLVKGLLGIALPGLALGAIAASEHGWRGPGARAGWRGELRTWWARGQLLSAALLCAALYLLPFGLERAWHGHWGSLQAAFEHSVGRFLGRLPDEGSEPIWFYAAYVFLLTAPWSPWLPLAWARGSRAARAWFWVLLVFFTLSASRRSYYLLPVAPAGALALASAWLEEGAAGRGGGWLRWARELPLLLLGALGSILAVGGPLALSWLQRAPLPGLEPAALPPPEWALAGGALCAWAARCAWQAERAGRAGRSGAILAASFLSLSALGLWGVLGRAERDRSLRPFAQAVSARVGSESLALLGERGATPLAFYLARSAALEVVPSRAALADYRGRVLAQGRDLAPTPGWRVVLRERAAAEGRAEPGPCARCAARRRACRHYLLLERTP